MWIAISKNELLDVRKYSFITSDIDNDGCHIIAFYHSYDDWAKDCPSYLSAPTSHFDSKEQRDTAFEKIKAMLIKPPVIERTG